MDENTLIGGDIFGGLVPLCHVSASQEDHLRRCPFAPEPYEARPSSSDSDPDNDAIPVQSTGIMMVSPPDSLEFRDNNNNSTSHDVFQTPPEDSTMFSSEEQNPPPAAMEGRKQEGSDNDVAVDGGSETVVVDLECVDDSGTGTVELGLDSELGFSEVQELQKVNSQSESLEFRVLSAEEEEEEEEGEEEGSDEQPPSKKSKIPPQNSGKSAGGLESETVNRHNHRSRSCQNVEFNGGGDAGFGEESSAKRKLEFEVVQSEIEPNDGVLEEGNAEGGVKEGVNNERVLGLNGLQSNGQEKEPAREFMETMAMEAEHGKCQGRLLPNWIHGVEKNENENKVRKAMTKNENKVRKVQLSRAVENSPLLYALKLLKEVDGKLANDSVPRDGFVEICKQQGMIFPRPSWWPEGGFNLVDNNDDNDD